MMIMASARDLITIFVALETISIPTFVLAGWRKHDTKSNEAALKYFLIGVISSALMLFGMSYVFGMSGSTLLSDISRYATTDPKPLFAVGIFLTIVGFAFKVSAVPFHFWAPDTYEGAPDPGHRLPVGRVEGRGIRRPAHDHPVWASSRRATRGSRSCGSSPRRR